MSASPASCLLQIRPGGPLTSKLGQLLSLRGLPRVPSWPLLSQDTRVRSEPRAPRRWEACWPVVRRCLEHPEDQAGPAFSLCLPGTGGLACHSAKPQLP